jgi:hypothetical protein
MAVHQIIFGVVVFLPSVLLIFAVLATFYRPANAYLAISWIPMTLFVVIRLFIEQGSGLMQGVDMRLMLESVCWTSLFQGMVGVVILARAVYKKDDWITPVIATILTVLPFFFRS